MPELKLKPATTPGKLNRLAWARTRVAELSPDIRSGEGTASLATAEVYLDGERFGAGTGARRPRPYFLLPPSIFCAEAESNPDMTQFLPTTASTPPALNMSTISVLLVLSSKTLNAYFSPHAPEVETAGVALAANFH
jgi:hypothetical protein